MGNDKDIEIGNKVEPERSPIVRCFAIFGSYLILILTFPVSIWACLKVIQEYERVVIFRLGRILKRGFRGPGILFVLPCTDTYIKVDIRTITFGVPPQEVMTKDSVTIHVDAIVYYKVCDPLKAITTVENYNRTTRLLCATTLRNVLATKTLSETLSNRLAITGKMLTALDLATIPWGIKIERVEIKDITLPLQLQRAMAAEAEAARDACAKVISAEGELKAAKALKEASDVIGGSPAALQLRYLQTLNQIATEKNFTIIFPLPIDIISAFLPRKIK